MARRANAGPAARDRPDEVTGAARRVLLDALDVLRDQHDAVVLVGAQAVYLRSRDADFSTSAYTTDADLGLNPALLGAAPLLEAAMTAGGFGLRDPKQPGLWVRNEAVGGQRIDIEVDLLVPGSLAQGGRSARIPPHDRMVARRVPGLEVAIVDNDVMTVAALEAGDDRSVRVNVASVPALLVAKAYKLGSGRTRAVDAWSPRTPPTSTASSPRPTPLRSPTGSSIWSTIPWPARSLARVWPTFIACSAAPTPPAFGSRSRL